MKDNKGEQFSEEVRLYDHYEYLDKVMSVTEGKNRIAYGYHVDGQLATVTKGKVTEEFTWDGLALVRRGTTSYVNEPHPGGGAPVAFSNGSVMFSDILGTTIGHIGENGYFSSSMTAFGDPINCKLPTSNFFTGKPHVDGLGHAFLMRNYRADLGKWPTSDPLGYPDGWNQMAYGVNSPMEGFDYLGADWKYISFGIEKRVDAEDATIPIVVAPNPGGVGQYDVLYPQNIRDAIENCIENNTPLDPSVAEWIFNAYSPSFGLSLDISAEISVKMRSMGIYDYEVVSIELLRREFNVEAQSVGILFYNVYFLWLVHVRYE